MRIIYNTSFIIDEDIEEEWIAFMKQEYLHPLRSQNLCDDILFTKVSIDQPDGKTYSLQLIFHSEERQRYFLENWLAVFEERIIQNYANRYVCFSSVLTEL